LQTSLSSNIASALCLLLSSVVLSTVRPSMHAGYVGEDYGWKYAFGFLHGLWLKICVQFSSRAVGLIRVVSTFDGLVFSGSEVSLFLGFYLCPVFYSGEALEAPFWGDRGLSILCMYLVHILGMTLCRYRVPAAPWIFHLINADG
jgi:hypothetical protein